MQAVHLCVPNVLHFEYAKRALMAGKHVMCEKPLAMSTDETAELMTIARDSGLAAGVCYNLRYYPVNMQAKALCQEMLGRIFHINGSYVQDWLLHDTDYNWRLNASESGPLRAVADIDACIEAFFRDEPDIVITVSGAARSPYYNMVELDDCGFAGLVVPPNQTLHARQNTPEVYDMTTVAYVARPEHVLETDYIFDGKVRAVVVPKERSLDIDTELDWRFAEFLLTEKGRGES